MRGKRFYNCSLSVFIIFAILAVDLFIPFNSSAELKVPEVKLSVKPLDLSRTPTTEEIMAAGQLGGQLYPTDDIQIEDSPSPSDFAHTNPTLEKGGKGGFLEEKIKRNREINLSFGHAIQEWNKHNYKEAVKLFKKHMEEYPDSPWGSEAVLHIGCDATYNGRYTEAAEQFTWIMEKNKDKKHYGAKMMLNKARNRLAILKTLQGNFNEATRLFADLKRESPDWRHRTYASHWIQRISRYKGSGLALLNCGAKALAQVLKNNGREAEAREVMEINPSSLKGQSILDLKTIAEKYGLKAIALKLLAGDLNNIPLPAILQIEGKQNKTPSPSSPLIKGGENTPLDPLLIEGKVPSPLAGEGKGEGGFLEGDKGHYWILEKIENTELTLFDPQSGDRFHQRPDELSREWDGNTIVFSDREKLPGVKMTDKEMEEIYGGCCGTPRPEDDLGPTPPPGPPSPGPCGSPIWEINMINMNLFMTDIPMWYTPPIGPPVNIQLSYNSQSAIAYNEPFGNKWQFNYGSYLVVDTGGNVTIFMPDGRRDVYTSDGQGGYTRPFGIFNALTKIAENHYELRFLDDTVYVYNIPAGTSSLQPFLVEIRDAYGQKLTFGYNGNVQLITITDAMNRNTTLTYNAEGLVERIDDPFGRYALFEYDSDRNLTKITDMGGIWTEFSYDADVYLTKIENAKGKWGIYIEPADGVFGCNSNNYPPPGDCTWQNYRITITNPLGGKEEYFYYGGSGVYSWFVSPRDYISWQSQTVNNFRSNVPKIYYYFTWVNNKGKISKIEYPAGGYINYSYDTVTGKHTVVTDFHNHSQRFTYNINGRVTSNTDAKNITTTNTYYPNNIDVQTTVNGLGTISYTYNGTHDVITVTDRLNILTRNAYNEYGQLTSVIAAEGAPVQKTTENIYDPLAHNLIEIKENGNTIMTFTYDSIGRIRTVTDSSGITLTYDYNNLDQITKITYPDQKFEAVTYSTCCPRLIDSKTDRSGLTTYYTYDALKRLIQVQGPEGTIGYEYDANGNRTKIIDADKKITTFEYNLDNRLIKRIYADGKFLTYTYDTAGLLTKFTNSRNIEKNYSYDANHNFITINYSDNTPDVTFTYDDYTRMIQRTDGMGLYQFGYDANNRLTSINGPWADDTITYQYDDLGQLKNLIPQGGQTVTYNYDTIGRLTNIQSGANTYTYGYAGVNPLIQSLTRPNGSFTEYLYNDPLKRLTEITNKTSAQAIINKHVFAYNNLDVISTETIETGTALDSFTAGLKIYNYNNLNQLLNSTNPDQSFQYDNDGNMTPGYTPDGYLMTMTYDAENRLKTLTYSDGTDNYETRYFYSGDSLLAKIEKYKNSQKIDETRFIRAEFLPIQERDGNNSVTREYTWGLDMGGGIGGLLNFAQSGQNYLYLYDGKGNVTALIDGSQNVVASYRYDEFGKLLKKVAIVDQPFRFSTKQYDEQTGLSYYGSRYYSPTTGKWITRDPLGELGGINLYGFVGNNPVNWVDPYGEYPLWIVIPAWGLLVTTVAEIIHSAFHPDLPEQPPHLEPEPPHPADPRKWKPTDKLLPTEPKLPKPTRCTRGR